MLVNTICFMVIFLVSSRIHSVRTDGTSCQADGQVGEYISHSACQLRGGLTLTNQPRGILPSKKAHKSIIVCCGTTRQKLDENNELNKWHKETLPANPSYGQTHAANDYDSQGRGTVESPIHSSPSTLNQKEQMIDGPTRTGLKPSPLIENEDGYLIFPQPPTTTRNLRISERKCKEYSEVVQETIAGLPLLTNPQPFQVKVDKCNHNAQQLIVGGQNASLGEFPHMAAVGFMDEGRKHIFWNCGGSLISEKFVLTAAHCTTSRLGPPTLVRIGEHNLKRDDDGAHPVQYFVKEVIRHAGYRAHSRYHDIALLRLSRPVTFSLHIRPACLYHRSTFNTDKTVATGWGRMAYHEEQSDVLLKVVLSIVDNEQCNKLYRAESLSQVLSRGIIGEQMCAGELTGGKDTCQGDSGGPIEITSVGNECVHHIIGVTSFGKKCGQPNAPGVYTRVSSYVDWIESVVWPQNYANN